MDVKLGHSCNFLTIEPGSFDHKPGIFGYRSEQILVSGNGYNTLPFMSPDLGKLDFE